MLFKALSAAVYGIDAYLVEVEVDVSAGMGNFLTVGLPDAAVKENKERIKAAITRIMRRINLLVWYLVHKILCTKARQILFVGAES
ncbi:MAG: hypothetical protein L0Z50_14220 [Verrucomicrobiales bacterium]|nr:hypothetical protein [Verrucomicrobiales bacterium]